MCGIIAAIARREVLAILMAGLKRLEYRGYDSAGIAIIHTPPGHSPTLQCAKSVGKVAELANNIKAHKQPLSFQGQCGIAHTRWATHGQVSTNNAHPHLSHDSVAVVHNGIIENHEPLRKMLIEKGYHFDSQTDTEVIAHLIHYQLNIDPNLLTAVKACIKPLDGAFALAIINIAEPQQIIGVRQGSPLVIGQGIGEHFLASDPIALRQVTDQFIYLEEGDITVITPDTITVWDSNNQRVHRHSEQLTEPTEMADKGHYRHYMLKEIYEQPHVLERTLMGRLAKHQVREQAFGIQAKTVFERTQAVQIAACGTSYHAGMVAQYWLEDIASIPCRVEVASEFRYRQHVVPKHTLFVVISQSGETADSLAALRLAKTQNYVATLAICNVPQSSLVREADAAIMTEAGIEMGVASTKAFTSQLVILLLLTVLLGRRHQLSQTDEASIVHALHSLSDLMKKTLTLDPSIKAVSKSFADKYDALFLGRGIQWPIAMEGALKLKEISYIHAESYPAGELKHGPLAMVDDAMPVVAVAPNDELLAKLKSNLEEVRARGGQLLVFADERSDFSSDSNITIIPVPNVPDSIAPIIYVLPLQLLAYHVAVLKGTDVDQPRNLAKSVTVE